MSAKQSRLLIALSDCWCIVFVKRALILATYCVMCIIFHIISSGFAMAPPSVAQKRRTSVVCLFLPSEFLLLDVVPFVALVHVRGTIYLRTLPPHRRYIPLSNNF